MTSNIFRLINKPNESYKFIDGKRINILNFDAASSAEIESFLKKSAPNQNTESGAQILKLRPSST